MTLSRLLFNKTPCFQWFSPVAWYKFAGIQDVIRDRYSEVITVDRERDSADLALANRLKPSDIVVTQDFGVAALALGKGCRVLNQDGMEYDADNIDRLLFERHLVQKIRRAGGRTKGMKKRKPEDDADFEAALLHMLDAEL